MPGAEIWGEGGQGGTPISQQGQIYSTISAIPLKTLVITIIIIIIITSIVHT